jgi:nucleoside-diphosphate-sugar epimerase
MRAVIFGATGRIGSHAVRSLVDRGDEVRAVSRSGSQPSLPGVVQVAVDVRDDAAVTRAVAGMDAVIAAMGPRSNAADDEDALAAGMANIVRAMTESGVRRLVVLSGAGITVPGDQKPVVDRVVSAVVRRLAKHVVRAKQREYEVIAASGLAWTALRPPLVIDGPARGYRLDLKLRPGARVTRADVGQAVCDQLDDETFVRQAPFVLPPP